MGRIVVRGAGVEQTYPLTGEVTVGRHPSNAIHIPEPRSSRTHARIFPEGDTYVIEDLKSANGTEVNGVAVTRHVLRHQDQIRIGTTILTYIDEKQLAEAEGDTRGHPVSPQGTTLPASNDPPTVLPPPAPPPPAPPPAPRPPAPSQAVAVPASGAFPVPGGTGKATFFVKVEGPQGTVLKAELVARENPYLVGRAQGHDIVLDDPAIQNPHVELLVAQQGVTVKNLATSGPVKVKERMLESGQSVLVPDVGEVTLKPFVIQMIRKEGTIVLRKRDSQPFAAARRDFILKRVWPEFEARINVAELERRGAKEGDMRREALNVVRAILDAIPYPFENVLPKEKLAEECVAEFVGLGVIEEFLADDDVTEIMCNGPNMIYIERKGTPVLSDRKFLSASSLRRVIERIVATKNRRIDESVPYVDTRLDDGSRVHAIIPPLALDGPTLTIRKFPKKHLGPDDLVRFGAVTPQIVKFLELAVTFKQNIIVSGGTGSGKTTLLNTLSRFIPERERVITVEDSAELRLQQPHVVRLEGRPANIEGKGEVTIRDLVRNCLRMRPDRIIVGECRGKEAFDMLQAMNTGHEGSMTTVHANNTRDAVARIESMCLMAGLDLPIAVVRQQISSAVNFIVQQSRLADGSRKLMMVSELTGMEAGGILMQPIFEFKQTGFDAEKRITGYFTATGMVPKFVEHLREMGTPVPMEIFQPVQTAKR